MKKSLLLSMFLVLIIATIAAITTQNSTELQAQEIHAMTVPTPETDENELEDASVNEEEDEDSEEDEDDEDDEDSEEEEATGKETTRKKKRMAKKKLFHQAMQTKRQAKALRKVQKKKKAQKALDPLLSDFALSTGTTKSDSFDISQLMQEAKTAIKMLNQETRTKKEQIKQDAEEKLKDMQAKITTQINKMRKEAQQMTVQIDRSIKRQSEILHLQTAQKSLNIMTQAEEEALRLKNKQRRENLAKKFKDYAGLIEPIEQAEQEKQALLPEKPSQTSTSKEIPEKKELLGTRPKATQEWKNKVAKDFYSGMSFMKSIILEGESPEEAKSFAEKFKEQNKWFDTTLRSTHHINDKQYKQIIKKHNRLKSVTNAQKKAHTHLDKLAKNITLSEDQKKKIKLAILYELNTLAEKKLSPLKKYIIIRNDEIKKVTKQTLAEFSVEFRQRDAKFTDVKILESKTIQLVDLEKKALEDKIEALEEQQDEITEQLGKAKKENQKIKIAAQEKLFEKANQQLDLEIKLKKKDQKLAHALAAKKKIANKLAEEQETKNELIAKLETAYKNNIDLQLYLNHSLLKAEDAKQKSFTQLQKEFGNKLEQAQKDRIKLETILHTTSQKAQLFKGEAKTLAQQNKRILESLKNLQDFASSSHDAAHLEALKRIEIESINKQLQEEQKTLQKIQHRIKKPVKRKKKLVKAKPAPAVQKAPVIKSKPIPAMVAKPAKPIPGIKLGMAKMPAIKTMQTKPMPGVKPGMPTMPVKSAKPIRVAQPTKRIMPGTSGPAMPTLPAMPTMPGRPAIPTKPIPGAKKAMPGMPAMPIKPATGAPAAMPIAPIPSA